MKKPAYKFWENMATLYEKPSDIEKSSFLNPRLKQGIGFVTDLFLSPIYNVLRLGGNWASSLLKMVPKPSVHFYNSPHGWGNKWRIFAKIRVLSKPSSAGAVLRLVDHRHFSKTRLDLPLLPLFSIRFLELQDIFGDLYTVSAIFPGLFFPSTSRPIPMLTAHLRATELPNGEEHLLSIQRKSQSFPAQKLHNGLLP